MVQRQTDGVCPETVLLRSTCPEESHKALEGKHRKESRQQGRWQGWHLTGNVESAGPGRAAGGKPARPAAALQGASAPAPCLLRSWGGCRSTAGLALWWTA